MRIRKSVCHFSKAIVLIALFAFSSATSQAQIAREDHALGLNVAVGHPAPSLIGGSFTYQPTWFVQWLVATGIFLADDLKIQTASLAVRFHFIPSDFTPMVGAGVSAFFFHGQGDIQGLEASTVLGSLMVGLDWVIHEHLRLAGGVQFHYPVRLTFPFVEVGTIF